MHTLPAQYRMKAHCPGLKGAPGTWIHLHMFNRCQPLLKWTTRKTKFWTRIYIGINERRCTSRQNHLKMWSIYWVMPISQCDQESIHYCHLLSHCSDCADLISDLLRLHTDYILLNGVQEEDSKWDQMIHLWWGLTLKQIRK